MALLQCISRDKITTTSIRLFSLLAISALLLTCWQPTLWRHPHQFHYTLCITTGLLWIPLALLRPDIPVGLPLVWLALISLVHFVYKFWFSKNIPFLSTSPNSVPTSAVLLPQESFFHNTKTAIGSTDNRQLVFGTYAELSQAFSTPSSNLGFVIDHDTHILQISRKPLLPLTALDREVYLLPQSPLTPYTLTLLPGALDDYAIRMKILHATLSLPCHYRTNLTESTHNTLIPREFIKKKIDSITLSSSSLFLIGLGEDMLLELIRIMPSTSNLVIVETSDRVLENLAHHQKQLGKNNTLVLGNSCATSHIESLLGYYKPHTVISSHAFNMATHDHNAAYYIETNVLATERLIKACQKTDVSLLIYLWPDYGKPDSSLHLSQVLGNLCLQARDSSRLRCLSLQWPFETLEGFLQTADNQHEEEFFSPLSSTLPLISLSQRLSCLSHLIATYTNFSIETSWKVTTGLNPELAHKFIKKLSQNTYLTPVLPPHNLSMGEPLKTDTPICWHEQIQPVASVPLSRELIDDKLSWIKAIYPTETPQRLQWAMKPIVDCLKSENSPS